MGLLDYRAGDNITIKYTGLSSEGTKTRHPFSNPALGNSLPEERGTLGLKLYDPNTKQPFSLSGNDERVNFLIEKNPPTDNFPNGYPKGYDLVGGDHNNKMGLIDSFIRGGVTTAISRRALDVKRIGNFLLSPNGLQFIAKEGVLQLLTPNSPKIFNPISLLAQVGVAGVSNLTRGGLIPNIGGVTGLFGYGFNKKQSKINREENYGLGDPGAVTSKDVLQSLKNLTSGLVSDLGDDLFGSNILQYNASYQETAARVDKVNYQTILVGGKDVSDNIKDFIPFEFEIINHSNILENNHIIFRAFIDNIADNFTANHDEVKYNGRPESFFTYNSFGRDITIGFKIAAQTRHEMKPLYQKINYLAAQTAPGFVGNRMKTSYMKLTVGDWFNELPGVLKSCNLSWNVEYPWEIKLDNVKDAAMLQLPHVLDVTINYAPIHNFVPNSNLNQSPFISGVPPTLGVTSK